MRIDEIECIFRKSSKTCSALSAKQCDNCSFYKSKDDYKIIYYVDRNGKKQKGVDRK